MNKVRIARLGVVGLLALGGMGVNPGMAGLFSDWGYRSDLTLAGYDRSEELTTFPLLVILDNTTIPGFSYGQFGSPADGADLRFANADGTVELNYEIEKWDTNGASYVWVQVPSLVGADTVITAFWGKSGAAAPAYTTNGSTWDGNYMGVWHLKEASGNTLADSTANANQSVWNSLDAVTGQVAGGMGSTSDGWAQIQDSASLKWANITVESWVLVNAGGAKKIISKGLSSSFEFLMWDYYGTFYFGVDQNGAWPVDAYAPNYGGVAPGVWYHVVGTYDGAAVRLFVNGAEVGSGTAASWTPYNGTGPLLVGTGVDPTDPADNINGRLDEQRVSNIARSANYIYATWRNQAFNTAFISYGATHESASATGWSSKMKIRFAGYDRPEALKDFPALVILSESIPGFRYRDFRSPQGADLRFHDSDETISLNYEIEKWDPNGSSYVWVQVPELADTNTFVWALWGRSGASAPVYATNGAAWDGNYMGVWHLKEGSGDTLADSTAHANHSVSNFLDAVTGQVAGGMGSASGGWAQIQDSASLKWANITVESWVLANAHPSKIIAKGLYSSFEFLMWDYYGTFYFGVDQDGSWPVNQYAPPYSGVAAGVWYHVVGTYDGAAVRLFVDGAEVGSGAAASWTPYNGTGPLFVGTGVDPSDPSGESIKGRLDEQRVSNMARSANYIYATWLNQASNSTFVECGEVTHPAGTLFLIR